MNEERSGNKTPERVLNNKFNKKSNYGNEQGKYASIA